MADILLSLKGLTKRYPGVVANKDIHLDIHRGEVHTLVGENGAGKSTLIKSLSGSVVPDEGVMIWEGKEYAHMTPKLSAELGISIVYQEHCLVEALSVAENISLGHKNTKSIFPSFKGYAETARKVFERMGVHIDPGTKVEDLPTASQQLVEIAKAISKEAKLLVLDEPTAPLTSEEIESLFRIIANLKEQGVTIIYISHRMDEVFRISDRITVLRDGETIETLEAAKTDRAGIIALMVGRQLTESFPVRTHKSGEMMLELQHITGNGVEDVSLNIRRGEIVGLAGLLGAGRTELARMVYGADPIKSGTVLIDGKPVVNKTPKMGIANKIGLIPEDRKHQGALLSFGVDWNTTLSCLGRLNTGGFLKFKEIASTAQKYIKELSIATPSAKTKVETLSGGNQQKVVLAKTLATESSIIIFDEPTRGIDVRAKQEIYRLMADMANEGKCILLISSDMEELLGMSDRIYVLAEGRLVSEMPGEEATQVKIMTIISEAMDSSVVEKGTGGRPT